MIAVTDNARKELKRILTENAEDNKILRLAASQEGQLGLTMDVQMPGDQTIEHEGQAVLLVEENLASHLGNISMDTEETPEGTMLTLRQEGCGSCCSGSCCGGESEAEMESGCGGGCCGDNAKPS
jgi:Fe-S cluster assembly iron-binding protein IscA